jgi:hypothetical protein
MKLQEIERLLEKYYNGETSLEEERLLKDYFSGDDVPSRFRAEKQQFEYLHDVRHTSLTDNSFDADVLMRISPKRGLLSRIMESKPLFYTTVGMAAAILILLAIFIRFEPMPQKIQDTYSDPEVAYQEAKKVLFFVSEQLNKGTGKLQPIATYNDGVKELENIKALSDGLTAASKIEKYNKIEQIITNTN